MLITDIANCNDIVNEDIIVAKNANFTFAGISNKNITVMPSATLNLMGICNGDVQISSGGAVIISGSVNGTVINNGNLRISGYVSELNDISNNAIVEPSATVDKSNY